MVSVRVAAAILVCVAACDAELHAPLDTSTPGYRVTQTFGQLIVHDGRTMPAPFMRLALPAGAFISSPVDGVVHYRDDFEGLGHSILLWPRKTFRSDTDYSSLQGLRVPNDLWIVFGHLSAPDVRAAINSRYGAVLHKADPSAETDAFMLGQAGNRDLSVVSSNTLANATRLGTAEGDDLIIAAFRGDPYQGRIDEWVNPLPYLLLSLPAAGRPALDDVEPVITDLRLRVGSNPDLADAITYQVGTATELSPPSVLFGHLGVDVLVQDTSHTGGEQIAIYETWYIVEQITTSGSRRVVSEGFRAMNTIVGGAAPATDRVYADLSSATDRTFWYRLRFEALPWVSRPPVRNLFATDGTQTLDLTGFDPGEYELVVLVRDAAMTTPYVERRLRFHLDNDPSAVAAARWRLWAGAVGIEARATADDAPGTIASGTLTLPLTVDFRAEDAPPAAGAAVWRYAVMSNGVPGATDTLADPAATTSINVTTDGIHQITVWLDQDGDGTRVPSEPSRTINVVTFDPALAITAEQRPLAGIFVPLADGSVVPWTRELRLSSAAPGIPATYAAGVTFHWEADGPLGHERVDTAQWVHGPFLAGGSYHVTAVAELSGARFERGFDVDVVAVEISPLHSVCIDTQATAQVTITPSPLPAGTTLDLDVILPANPTDNGEIELPGGPIALAASGPVTVRALHTTTARDNVAVRARIGGEEVIRESLSVCDLQITNQWGDDRETILIGLWQFAYNASFAVESDFITFDDRRFHVRVTDWDKAVDPVRPDVINARLAVDDPVAPDDPTVVRLVETGPDTGIFESPSQLAVAPDFPAAFYPDDDYRADSGFAGRVDDDAIGDRTHRTSIHGVFHATYQPDPSIPAIEVQVPVCRGGGVATCDQTTRDTPCRARLQAIVFNEPFDDVGFSAAHTGSGDGAFSFNDANHNTVHDPGEQSEPFIDMSAGATTPGHGGARGPVRTVASVDELVRFASIAWAQACIEVEPAGPPIVVDAPKDGAGVDVLLDGNWSGIVGGAAPTDEELALGAFPPGATDDPLNVFYVGPIIVAATAYASIPALRLLRGFILPDSTALFLGPLANVSIQTLAHELWHAFINRGDTQQDQIFFVRNTEPWELATPAVNQYRRMKVEDAQTNARQHRAAPGDVGNTILVDP